MQEYKLYKSPWKAIKILLGSSVFVVLGIYMLSQPDSPKLVAWLSIIFFGLGFPVAIFHLLDRRPQIIINELGIFDRTAHKDFINWEIIHDAYLVEVYGQKFICLIVDPQFEPSGSKSGLAKKMVGLSKAMGFQELNISLGQVVVDEIKLTQFILAMRTAEKSNLEKILPT